MIWWVSDQVLQLWAEWFVSPEANPAAGLTLPHAEELNSGIALPNLAVDSTNLAPLQRDKKRRRRSKRCRQRSR